MSKNIIICCDGTENEISDHNTNIVKIFSIVDKAAYRQLAFYDPGVGTFGKSIEKKMGYAFAYGLQKNIEDAYRYLMNNYSDGDKIFLFGFSRGAFTVRSLAGMIHKCGLLYKGNENLICYASKIYNTRNNDRIANIFKKNVAQSIPIHFIGVFDTVASLGWIYGYRHFFDATLNKDVSFGYHAMALDEKRRMFYPSLWDESRKTPAQTIEQVWFAGSHSDIGGGYEDDSILANIPLKWMLNKAIDCGLKVDKAKLSQIEINPLAKIHNSFKKWGRIFGSKERKLKDFKNFQKTILIHKSVQERQKKDLNYNLTFKDNIEFVN